MIKADFESSSVFGTFNVSEERHNQLTEAWSDKVVAIVNNPDGEAIELLEAFMSAAITVEEQVYAAFQCGRTMQKFFGEDCLALKPGSEQDPIEKSIDDKVNAIFTPEYEKKFILKLEVDLGIEPHRARLFLMELKELTRNNNGDTVPFGVFDELVKQYKKGITRKQE